jgi:hypothetical protein
MVQSLHGCLLIPWVEGADPLHKKCTKRSKVEVQVQVQVQVQVEVEV